MSMFDIRTAFFYFVIKGAFVYMNNLDWANSFFSSIELPAELWRTTKTTFVLFLGESRDHAACCKPSEEKRAPYLE